MASTKLMKSSQELKIRYDSRTSDQYIMSADNVQMKLSQL